MSFDGIMARAITAELNETVLNGRISKIKQPYKMDISMTIRAGRVNHQLFLSSNPNFARLHFTSQRYENAPEPPMFCVLLRKHLEGGFIRRIEQHGMERIITLYIEGKDEIGEKQEKKLIVEIMGKHSNIILLDAGTNLILDSLKHLPPSVNSYRTILPGRPYIEPPSQEKADPLAADRDDVLRHLDSNQGRLDKQLLQAYTGISPQITKEVIHQAGLGSVSQVADTFVRMMDDVSNLRFQPQMIVAGAKEYYSVLPLDHLKGDVTTFTSTSELLERFHTGKAERDRVKQQSHDMQRFLQNEWQKNKKKIKKLEKTLQQSENSLDYQKYGELLTAHLHLIKGGEKEIEVMDYYDPDGASLTLTLDPRLSPSENAQKYFKRYNKAKTSLSFVKRQIRDAKREMNYLDQILQQLASASPGDIEDIREELAEQGYMKRKMKKGQKRKKPSAPVIEKYLSTDGTLIFVGKNNKQNEYLTNKLSRASHTWLHTKDIPGSHVVIQAEEFSEQTLKEAASIAAFYSKARESGSVPVDYTLIRHVKKPSGAKPGFVTYDNQSTLFVTPTEELVLQLRENEKQHRANLSKQES